MTSTLTAQIPSRTSSPALDFEALYRAARDDVYAYVATLLRDRVGGRGRHRRGVRARLPQAAHLQGARGSERAWLFGIARNAALDELRRRKRAAALAAEPADVDAAPPEDAAETALRRAAVRVALARSTRASAS